MNIDEELVQINEDLRGVLFERIQDNSFWDTKKIPKKYKKVPNDDDKILTGIAERLFLIEKEMESQKNVMDTRTKNQERQEIDKKIKHDKITKVPHLGMISLVIAIIVIVLLWTKSILLNILLVIGLPILILFFMGFVIEPFLLNHASGFLFFLYKRFHKEEYNKLVEESIQESKERNRDSQEFLKVLEEYHDRYEKVFDEVLERFEKKEKEANYDRKEMYMILAERKRKRDYLTSLLKDSETI